MDIVGRIVIAAIEHMLIVVGMRDGEVVVHLVATTGTETTFIHLDDGTDTTLEASTPHDDSARARRLVLTVATKICCVPTGPTSTGSSSIETAYGSQFV